MARRKLTFQRKLIYSIVGPAIGIWLKLVWLSSKIIIRNETQLISTIKSNKAIIPCFWHNQLFIGAFYVSKLRKQGITPGFLISPSRDGELGAYVVKSWQAIIIRGSSTRTGAQALRDLYLAIKDKGISPANTPDGPTGPIYKAKPGVIMLSQSTGAPIIPLACAYQRCWTIKSWDRLMIPKLFNRIVIDIGDAMVISKSTLSKPSPLENLEAELNRLTERAKQHI